MHRLPGADARDDPRLRDADARATLRGGLLGAPGGVQELEVVAALPAGASPSSRPPRGPRATSGNTSTERSPAAMRAAPVAAPITPRSMPICVAATTNVNDVACRSPAAATRRPSSIGR